MAGPMDDTSNTRLALEICTPERLPITLKAVEVVLPGAHGVFSVLPGHTPLLSTLTRGVMIAYGEANVPRLYAVNGGFAEVLNDRVLVLTHTIEHSGEIDIDRAHAAREAAETMLKKRDGEVDVARTEAMLERALARIDAHSGHEFL